MKIEKSDVECCLCGKTCFPREESVCPVRDVDLFVESDNSRNQYGGQHTNPATTGVKITHLPSRVAVVVDSERSQLRNKEIAFKIMEGLFCRKEKLASS